MVNDLKNQPSQTRLVLPFSLALAFTLLMGVAYTLLDIRQFAEPLQSVLAFLPGLLSLAALSGAGMSRLELKLRYGSLSRPGLLALAGVTILLLPILLSSSGWLGWRWLPALIYGPASGVAQELYFRSALLGGLEKGLGGRRRLALLCHALIFIGFHFRTFQALPSISMALIVGMVLFLAGCGWGWQVQRDRTVVWAMLQHSLFLMLMSMFDWGA